MVESEAKCLTEKQMLGAVMYGHEQLQVAIDAIDELAQRSGKPKWDFQPSESNSELTEKIDSLARSQVESAYEISGKTGTSGSGLRKFGHKSAKPWLGSMVKKSLIRPMKRSRNSNRMLFEVEFSLENRELTDAIRVRFDRFDIRTQVFPRTHGSAAFTRGETQALVMTTLGTERDAQIIDALEGEHRDPFLLHYNFPPFCVGETGRVGSPKRREIGHGRLAKRAIAAVLPERESCPYVIPGRFRNYRIQWLQFHGNCLRNQLVAHGCRGQYLCACFGGGDGIDQGRRQL